MGDTIQPNTRPPVSISREHDQDDRQFEYDAFISYRRRDATGLARWLRNRIKRINLPPEVIKNLAPSKQDLYKRKPNIWLDTAYEKASDDFLLNKVFPALDQSARLIVISTPAAFESIVEKDGTVADNWLVREVDQFLGEATSKRSCRPIDLVFGPGAPDTIYPGRLAEKDRIDWVDFRSFGNWRIRLLSEALDDSLAKLVAAIYDVPEKCLPDLRREERRRRRNWVAGTLAVSLAVGLVTTGLAVWGFSERASAISERDVAEKRLHNAQVQESRLAAQTAQQEPDPEKAIETALRGLPRQDSDRPFETVAWTALVEAESKRPALRVLRGVKQTPINITWDPSGQRLAAADGEQLAIWDAASGRRTIAVLSESLEVWWSPDGSLIADGTGAIRSTGDGSLVSRLPKPFTGDRWAPMDARLLAIGEGRAKIFRGSDGGEEQALAVDGQVQNAIWSPNGDRVLVLTTDSRAHICDAATGRETRSWALEGSNYKAMDWSPDGHLIAIALDKRVTLWNAADGSKRADAPAEYTKRIQFSPSMAWLMIAGLNGVTLNDLHDGHVLNSVEVGGTASVNRDGQLIAIAANGGVFEWEPERNRKRWLRRNALGYDVVAWSPDGRRFATASDHSLLVKNKDQRTAPEIDLMDATTGWEITSHDPAAGLDLKDRPRLAFVSLSADSDSLDVYDVVTRRRLQTLGRPNHKVVGWAWRPSKERLAVVFDDGAFTIDNVNDQSTVEVSTIGKSFKNITWGEKWLVVRYADGTERIISIETGSEIAAYTTGMNTTAPTVFWSAKHILVQPGDSRILVVDPTGAGLVSPLKTELSDLPVKQMYWSPDGQQVVTVSATGLGVLWDIETGRRIFAWPIPSSNIGVSWSPDGSRVVTFSSNRDAELRDSRTGRAMAWLHDCWSTSWSPDSHRVLIGCGDGFYIDAATGKSLSDFKEIADSGGGSWEAAWDPSGRLGLATVASDNFYIFDRDSGEVVQHVYIPEPWIIRGVWDASGQQVAIFSGDRIVSAFGFARFFDARSGREIVTLEGHEKNILGGVWDATGTKFLTWSQDTTTRLWDLASGLELARLSGHSDFVLSGAWSEDGKRIVTQYFAPPPYIWDARPFTNDRSTRIDWMRASLAISSVDPASSSTVAVTALDDGSLCEKGADDPIDPMRRYPGVLMGEINPYPKRTASACEKAVLADPQNGRLNDLYGRVMLHEHKTNTAFKVLETALVDGYSTARLYLGEMRLDASDNEHFAPDSAIAMLEEAAKTIPYADVVLAQYFREKDAQKAEAYLGKALQAGEPHAYEVSADREERLAMSGPDADSHWIVAFRDWSIAFNLSRFKLRRGSADWEFPLARREALAWLLADHGHTLDVVAAYREALKVVPEE